MGILEQVVFHGKIDILLLKIWHLRSDQVPGFKESLQSQVYSNTAVDLKQILDPLGFLMPSSAK